VWVIHEDADRSRPFHADYEGGDAMPGRSPTVRRRRLGIELRQLREAAHLTLEQAAGRLEFSTAKLSRIENAQVSATALDVRGMLEIYGADAKLRDALIQMAREARQRGWWQTDYGDLPIATRVGLEIAAASIRQYAGLLVPGLLQVPDYALAVLRAIRLDLKPQPEEIERRVELRMARQSILTQDDPPAVWMVLDEATLRRPVGGPKVMHQQLQHLAEMGSVRNVTLQVLPYAAGEHPGLDGGFSIIGFPERADPDVVYIETTTSDLYLEEADAIDRYTLLFDHIRAVALSPAESTEFIASVAREL